MTSETSDANALPEPFGVDGALKMFETYKNHWADNYREALIDLKMAVGDRETHWGNGWDSSYQALPVGTPAVVVNELPQYIHQVTNDIRQNTPAIRVIPEDDGDEETADIFGGLIRGIEYKSCADEAYDTAAEYAVKCGIGFIRSDHDYCGDDTDEQEMQIKSVPDPLSVWIDPASVECDGRDANGAIALEPISKKDFEKLYPKKDFISFTDPQNKEAKDVIILANIYIRTFEGKHGRKPVVKHYKFSGADYLGGAPFPGKYIPYTPVYGEVCWIDGKRIVSSLIRQARDPQRRLNHWAGKESQILSMAPIAPVQAVEGTIVNERKQWQIPGLENVLEYRQTDLDGNPAPAPSRLQPPTPPAGFINAMQGAKENIKESMGIYSAGLGKREGDASGRALESLKQEGDVATFHFPDNVRRSINQVGRVQLEAIPEIYDTARIVQIVDEETEVKMVGINGAMRQDQPRPYDLTKGKYHVRVTTGASYTTKRQQASELFGELLKQNPELLQVIGDLWARNLDVPGAEALSARFKKLVPANLQEDEQQDPQKQQMAQVIQQLQAQVQEATQVAQQLQAQVDNKQAETQVKMAEIELKREELAVKAQEIQAKYQPKSDTKIPEMIVQAQIDQQARAEEFQHDFDLSDQAFAQSMAGKHMDAMLTPEVENGDING